VVRRVEAVLSVAQRVDKQLTAMRSTALADAVADIRAQIDGLVYRGFISEIGWRRLPDVHRYVRAALRRLEKLPHGPAADRERTAVVQALQDEYAALLRQQPAEQPVPDDVAEIRWMLEELRVRLFAQTLKTAYPVSDKRIRRALAASSTPLKIHGP
jgi:ATP-dependent helicase HrpA